MVKRFDSDIDIDTGDRDLILQHIPHVAASMHTKEGIRRHNTGIHVTDIPYDVEHNCSALDYQVSEQRGYFKLDLLNVFVYKWVRDEAHLEYLMREPDWTKLQDESFVEKLIHLGNHYRSLKAMREPINSIPRLAMFLAVIRPSKKHLIGRTWKEVADTIWESDPDGYAFKKSHAVAYAHLVIVHMNLLAENPQAHAEYSV